MGFFGSPSGGALASAFASQRIGGLGDSMTARSVYQPTDRSLASIPQWLPSTAYVNAQSVVQNNGLIYICTGSGTSASSGGPTGTANSTITDGTVSWRFSYPQYTKSGVSWLTWVEAFSGGRFNWRQSDGYGGQAYALLKFIILAGGQQYTNPTLDLTTGSGQGGATATVHQTDGVIDAITITSPGQSALAGNTDNFTLNDPTGFGADLVVCGSPSGTFATPGATTHDALGYLRDAVNSNIDIFVVSLGTNDVSRDSIAASTTIANITTIYETLINAGKKVIVVPIPPRSYSTSTAQREKLERINKFIRAYYRRETWANPRKYVVGQGDFTGYWSDGASTVNGVIGGTSGTYPAMTVDGLHQSTRGAMLAAISILESLNKDFGYETAVFLPRAYTYADGYDIVNNPAGNMLEGIPWIASTAYVPGQLVTNGTNVYYCSTAGTSAGSGGPTGTGTNITDGTVVWQYANRKAGTSVFAGGTGGQQNAASGITYSGSLAQGWKITRNSGTASGTVIQQIENPWSNGEVGQRQVTNFNLGGGGTTEEWAIYMPNQTLGSFGVTTADLGVTPFYWEIELEVSAIVRLTLLYAKLIDNTSQTQATAGNTPNPYSALTGAINSVLASVGEAADWPNGGKVLFRTEPMIFPSWMTLATAITPSLTIGFDASGTAGSATATIKMNYAGLKRYGVV